MATTLVDGDIVRATYACYGFGQAGLNVIHLRIHDVAGAPSDLNLAETLDTTAHTKYKALLGTDVSYYGVKVNIIRTTPTPRGMVTNANEAVGTGGAQSLPAQVAPIITCYTDYGGPAYRGRIYVPFCAEDIVEVATNRVTAAGQLLLQALADDVFKTATVTVGGNTCKATPVLYHRGDDTFTDITSAQVKGKFGTQTRRGAYGQPNAYPPI